MRPLDTDHASLHPLDTRRQLRRLMTGLEVESPRGALVFGCCIAIAWGAYAAATEYAGLDEAPARALFILVAAALLWVTEAAPAFAVGILVIGLEVLLLAGAGGEERRLEGQQWETYVAVLGHPLIWLFFGGFVLAAGTARTGLDRWLAVRALARFGDRPSGLLAGVMTVTFGFSMFMSNTATTALMLALLAPVTANLSKGDPFRKALLLGTAIAANVGGMGSLIGTPPNAIAAGALAEVPGQAVDFLQWLAFGLPPATVLSILGWLFLLRRYPAAAKRLDVMEIMSNDLDTESQPDAPRWRRWVVTLTGISTVLLWMTGGWHHAPTAVVSLLPIVVFTTMSVLGPTDIRNLPWDVLFLLAGGLALGEAIKSTGLTDWMVSAVPVSGLGPIALALSLGYACALLSNFMSNTAAANVLVPIAISLSAGFEDRVALPLALAASSAMCLPIATPPNALVFSTGKVRSQDFMLPGLMIGALAPIFGVAWALLVR
jgi:sodium-dependent dicarboxylate transporter 2/3/5